MTGLDVQLAQRIEEVLRIQSFDGSSPDTPETLRLFSALAGEYLAQAVPWEVRPLATEVAAMARLGTLKANDEVRFRAASERLGESLEAHRRLDATTSQFADDPEMVQEFLVEAREHLSRVEAGLLSLEREPDDGEALNAVFRSFHSIKGLAAFLGASAIQELAHETESVLDLARSGNLALSSGTIDLILRSADDLTKCLDLAGTRKLSEIPRRDKRLLESLLAASRGESQGGPAEPAVTLPSGAENSGATRSSVQGRRQENMLRVEASKLEYLIDMVGELVIASSVVSNDLAVAQSRDPLLSRNLKQLARVVQEVQKSSMSMRMVSVGTLFRKMDRLIRDLGRKTGKRVDLITAGDEVELDRTIVEALADPMVHMIRNSVDHGLETPADRLKSGKNEQCIVRLRAMHDAGDIVIELADDGRGLDAAKILAKAKRSGLVGEWDQPDEDSVFRLIFEPGFSTAEKLTDLSGRGVGMDVVLRQIQKLRGRIAIHSVPGRSCTFELRLPLTLAIIDGLVTGVGSQRYILPMFAVREMFSPGPDTFITLENRAEAALFRDKLLPVIRLSRLLETRSADRAGGVLIVVEGREHLYCVAVDELIGKQEVVIKSLGNTYRDIPAISGGSILGDGRVGLIIDVNSLRYRQ
jgi:two-component system, chemotaxis family, sensor kinase CheA